MSLFRELEIWWNGRHERRRNRHREFAEQALAEEEAKLPELVRCAGQCKDFTFDHMVIECKGRIARLKRIVKQNE
jgi:hypothetical protein